MLKQKGPEAGLEAVANNQVTARFNGSFFADTKDGH